MVSGHNPMLRFGMSVGRGADFELQPAVALANAPPLPAVNYGLVGKTAPKLLTTPSKLSKASTVVIT